jgi:TolB-like protein/predicted Zn-dependent protease
LSAIRLKLLGQFECLSDAGTPLTLQTRKAEVLLAFLALEPGVRHPRDRLINLLWSDRSEEQARNSLRQSLSAIKKPLASLKTMPLSIDRTTVLLDADLIEVDALKFEQLASQIESTSLSAAAALYTGEFLEGITIRDSATQDWLAYQRDRYKRLVVDTLTQLSAEQIAEQNFTAAIESGETLVDYDPFTESGWRNLMQAYDANGHRNHALLAYKRCCDFLLKELEVEPEAETTLLRDSIRVGTSEPMVQKATPARAERKAKTKLSPVQPNLIQANAILVMPFENLSNDAEQQYFSEGITEGVIVGLSTYPSLSILSRHYSFALQQQKSSLREMADQHGVRYVVEGSVRKTPQNIRITAQLIDTDNGEQIWGKRFDSAQDKIFDIEDELTRTIVANIKGKMDVADEGIAYLKPAKDMSSYDLLMKGKYHLAKFNPIDNQLGREALSQCIAQDSECELAHNYLYRVNILDWISGWTQPREQVFEDARAHIERAIILGENESIIQASYAEFLLFDREYEHCADRAERAYRINSNDTETLATLSAVHAGLGNIDLGLEMADTCRTLDPFHPWIDWVNGIAYYAGKRYQDALNTFKMMANPPDEIDGWLAICNERLGHHTAAEKHLQLYVDTVRKNMPRPPETLEDWHKLWQSISAAKHHYGSDYPFDVLCVVGLKQYIEITEGPRHGEKLPAVVVLPFDNLSGDPQQEYFSDGITESIIDNLSLFPGMSVKSRNSSFAYKQQIKSAGEISKELDVNYIVEGSIRRSTNRVRVTVQLVEAEKGNQVWSQRFDSELEDIFELEEELSRIIVGHVTGRIESNLQQIAIAKSAHDQQAYDYLLEGLYHVHLFTAENSAIALEKLTKCIDRDPNSVHAHALLASNHIMIWLERWSPDFSKSFKLAEDHATKAIELAPNNSLALTAYAELMIFSRKYATAQTTISKLLKINPGNPEALAQNALLLNMTGELDAALENAKKCMHFDPHHSWGHWQVAEALLNSEQYDEAIDAAMGANTSPSYLQAIISICHMKSGRVEKAQSAAEKFLSEAKESMKSFPQSSNEWQSYWRNNMPYKDMSINDAQFELLEQAGLCDQHPEISIDNLSAYPTIAVLPFKNLSNDPEQEYFSDGISESIIQGLSMYKGLIVKSSQSSFAFRQHNDAIHDVAEKLKVKYIVDGSVRKVGNKVRLAAQLIDSESGNQLWGKHYDADLEDVLTLEEEMSQIITGTIRGRIDSDIQQTAVTSPATSPQSYDLYLRGIYHIQRFTTKDQALGKQYLNQCIELDPEYALAHAYITAGYHADLEDNLCSNRPEILEKAKLHIDKALQLAPDNAFVHGFMSEYYGFARDFDQAEFHADKAIELNPTLPDGYYFKAWALGSTRRLEESMQYADKCLSLDPHHPYVGRVIGESYRNSGLFDKAIEIYRSLPYTPLSVHLQIAICLAGAGKLAQAKTEMVKYHQRAKTDMPNYPQSEQGWLDYTTAIFAFQIEEDANEFYDLAVEAGLLDFTDNEPTEHPSIAVLPFQNLSSDPEQALFATGITGDIVNILSKFRHLRTVSSYSTALYKDRSTPMSKIADEQNVRYILDGGIRKNGSKIRINAQLIDSTTNENIWSEQFDRHLDDLFAIQDEITIRVASAMKVTLLDGERSAEFSADVISIKAWECCVLAAEMSDSYIKSNISKARALTLKAIELEPEYTYAWSLLSWTHWQEAYAGWSEDIEKSLDEAETAVTTSLKYNANNWDAWSVMGYIHLMRDQPELAIEASSKASEIAPGVFDAVLLTAFPLNYAGQYKAAFELYERSLLLCPVQPNWARLVGGMSCQQTGQVSKAIQLYQEGIDIEPESPICRYYLMDILIDIGEHEQAQQVADDIRALVNPMRVKGLVQTYSHDKTERDRFETNLSKMGFN